MSKKATNNKMYVLVIALFVLLLIVIFSLIVSRNKNANPTETGNIATVSTPKDNTKVETNQAELERLKAMTERGRIEYYVAKFIKLIESEDYDKAYALLNVEYKKNYFANKSEFEKYCKSKFSKMQDVQYKNFERNGDVYIVWVTVTDTINGRQNAGDEMNFVVKENSFNDFELSFSKN